MTDNEEAEFKDVLLIMIKRSVAWYREQDFSHMNDDVRPALESIFSPGYGYDPSASAQIGINMMMIGQVWQDKRFTVFANRAARTSYDRKTMGKLPGKMALRQLLDEVSEVLREPGFYTTE
ncbi:hypothetical protein QU24_04795 [Pantoea rodasii]|uniref:Uncharacterized protein n=1 Tax=Pantoea rodasii TaxID=1076549 RepID=A0A0B1R9E1_9GAMM|nr:hypothetical protein [Pantoea rodasii]KHJ69244.1 hypothetical protein QU24_04795 [Pantoea rodasii]